MEEESKDTKNFKILLLEDEDALAQLYMRKLTQAGYEVRLFEKADQLLKEIGDYKADLAFLDHALHGENKSGLDVIPALKEVNPEMTIVMLSNYSEFQMEKQAKEAGASDYLLKINTPPSALVSYADKLST